MTLSLAIVEVKRFAAQGGRTILEACADKGNGRDPEGLARISRESGLNVVMGSGIYLGSRARARAPRWQRARDRRPHRA